MLIFSSSGTSFAAITLWLSICIFCMSSVEIFPPPLVFDSMRSLIRWLRAP